MKTGGRSERFDKMPWKPLVTVLIDDGTGTGGRCTVGEGDTLTLREEYARKLCDRFGTGPFTILYIWMWRQTGYVSFLIECQKYKQRTIGWDMVQKYVPEN